MIHRGLAELSPDSGSSLCRPPAAAAARGAGRCTVWRVYHAAWLHLPCAPFAPVCAMHFDPVPSPGPVVHSVC